MIHKNILAALLAASLFLSLTACSSPGVGSTVNATGFPGTADKDMVTLNIVSEPSNLNPLRMRDTIDQSILYHCMAGLTKLDASDEPVADLAERWDINEDSTVYTLYLRQDSKWSNGDSVTANDFYYAWVSSMTPSTGTLYASYLYENIKNGEAFYRGEVDTSQLGVKVIDDYTLEIEWSHPITNGLFFLSQPFYLPINRNAYEEIGDAQYAKEANQMVTNGAYKITEWVHDDHITLEKADYYYDSANTKIPRVKMVMIGDSNTALNAFTAGEIDLCNLYSEQIPLVEQVDASAVRSYIDGGSWYLQFNTRDEYLSNANLRKALSYSVDVQSLLDYVINDGSIAADGLVPGIISGTDGKRYTETRGSLFGYDADAASAYLDAALEELGLEKSELQLMFYGSDTTYNKNQAAYLQQQWKEHLGLDVELKSMSGQALAEAESNGDFTFAVCGWGPTENDAITFLENFVSDHPNNYGRYSNAEYDALITASRQEGNAQKRQEMLTRAETLLIGDAAVGPLYFTCSAYAVSDKVEGLVRTPFQYVNACGASITG